MARIYLVDDDYASGLIVENLRLRGHDARRISSAADALENLDDIVGSDLVILDLIMPRPEGASETTADGALSTGMLVFRELRRRRADLPILVYTANQDAALVDIITADPHARYLSRWSTPKFHDFVAIIFRMLGIEPIIALPRPLIVHGHDDKTKLEVKNYLQNALGLPEPIILHEQPGLGRTLIEKFEDLSAASQLAFVVLTPDDRVASPSDGDADKRRARQNVIFELGFFLGALGRRSGRVLLLHKGPLDLPSDLDGIAYVDIGKGVEAAGEQIRREIFSISREHNLSGG